MKITPVTGPGQVQDLSTPEPVREARMKAAFEKAQNPSQTQEYPVLNANSISTEELSAVKPPLSNKSQVKQALQDETIETTDDSATNVVEPTTEATADSKDKERFDRLARQERALRAKVHQQDLAFKKREADLKAREEAIKPQTPPDLSNYIDKARIKQDAISALEEVGVSWDELTNQAINRQTIDPRLTNHIARLEAKIAQLEETSNNSQKTYQEQQQAQYQAAIKQIKADAKHLVYTDPEFETVKAMNAVKDVVELIEQTYAKDGVVLSVEEAAKEVESYLVEEAMKITQIDKIKKRMAAANASRVTSEEKTQASKQTQMKTLTNATSSTRPLTARERAIAAAEGRLKS